MPTSDPTRASDCVEDRTANSAANRVENSAEDRALRYSFGRCSLGTGSPEAAPVAVLVACRGEGVCAILLGDSEGDLLSDLQGRFRGETCRHDAPGMAGILEEVGNLIAGRRDALRQPLAPEGTPFQKGVWTALRAIPSGTTATYTQLARTLGLSPTAVRAVAGACAANPCAVAIPCHRVVRGDGALAGYRWGVERKRALLRREAEAALAGTPFTLAP